MRLISRLTFKLTLILVFVNRGDGFMFSAWLRSTTEKNLPMLGQYKHQNYATNEAHSAATGAGAHRYVPNKDSGKANAIAIAAAATPPHASYTSQTDKDTTGIAAYNNQRTGISPPTKYDKPWKTFDAIVVQSIPSALPSLLLSQSPAPSPSPLPTISYVAIPANNFQYLYYRDEAKAQPAQNIASFTSTPAPQKFVNVELNYKDDTIVEKIGESVVLSRKTPSSVALDPVQPATESSVSSTAATSNSSSLSFETDSSSRTNVPNRPIKLLGPNAVYAKPASAPVPASTQGTNLTFAPQFYYAPPAAADIQYVPYPFLRSPLLTPFLYKNTPRAVSERSEIVPPSPPPPSAFQITNPKPEKPVCENCVPSTAFRNYSHTFKVLDSNENVFHKPCAQEIAAAHPDTATISSTFKSSNMAYILVPSQIIGNRAS